MEKIPAACAMDWSIQLEKGLRLLNPDKSVQALEKIGGQLEWWMSEPEFKLAEYRMFGLIPGEDKLFLNAIFMRLADAFRFGNKRIKHAVVKLFLRMKRGSSKNGIGILSIGKLDNYLEFLSRVKEVADKGDVDEKAMALTLFGCCAYIAKDCVDVRYMVLSSLVSEDALVVKAALFAAGCFCELSYDLAHVYLEMLSMVVFSRETSMGVKLAGARTYARSWCSFSLADKAYKTGLKLLMDSSEDDFSAAMLISLSRIASRWTLLIPIQVELLALFLSEEKSLQMQITSLRCHRLLLARGACNVPSIPDTIQKLFGILQRSELQPTLQIEAFKVLHEILLFHLSIIPCDEIPELFLKMMEVVKTMEQSSIVSTRLLFGRVLSGLSAKVLGRVDNVSGGNGPTLVRKVISFFLDRILLLATPKVDFQKSEPGPELEVKNMISVLNKLVQQHPYLQCPVLNNICLFIGKLMMMHNGAMETEESGTTGHEMTELGSNLETPLESKLVLYLSKVLFTCLQNLEVTNNETNQALDALKVKAENVHRCSYFDIYTRACYFLLLHLHSTVTYMLHMADELISPCRELGVSYVSSILQVDLRASDFSQKILGRKNYWVSYKVARNAVCQGAWSTAALIFEQLIPIVQSSSCSCWLRSLSQFSTSEKEIMIAISSGDTSMKNLVKASNSIVSAEEILATSDMGQLFSFQRWFLTLRAKFLEAAGDAIKLLGTSSFISTSQISLMHSFVEVSLRMRKVAQELDLLSVSFMGMDRQSVTTVSALALSCSIMAFTAGFAFLLPKSFSSQNYGVSKSESSEVAFHALLIEDLMWWLRQKDIETRKKLMVLVKSFHNDKGDFLPRFQTRISCTSYEGIVLQKLCEHTVGEIFRLQNEAVLEQQADITAFHIIPNGSRLLSDVISNLLSVPLRIPRYFFRLRPPVVPELFVTNESGEVINPSTVLSGPHLSLSLCLQLKNMAHVLKKVYCVISCKAECEANSDKDAHEEAIELREKMAKYMSGECEDCGNGASVNKYLRFELNERGQGFSSCLVDVSGLPKGCYGMKWQCGGIDGEGCYWTLLPLVSTPLFTLRI